MSHHTSPTLDLSTIRPHDRLGFIYGLPGTSSTMGVTVHIGTFQWANKNLWLLPQQQYIGAVIDSPDWLIASLEAEHPSNQGGSFLIPFDCLDVGQPLWVFSSNQPEVEYAKPWQLIAVQSVGPDGLVTMTDPRIYFTHCD